ncbi:hypothetical protein [Aminobacter ciceronei]|uniref:Uncharacterized protein n=1 Tax=Aminobacter ciceronei TaxID=150723 RepID=A0ABR6C5V4_9HYPH|nr:hypothetical protein [Aminobacter ciceronei]MBA8906488.1 hypothetical protein [Aminobacter ciceronei]MBA9020386.1 hypothetical protein [Aminobacter ciceronei]
MRPVFREALVPLKSSSGDTAAASFFTDLRGVFLAGFLPASFVATFAASCGTAAGKAAFAGVGFAAAGAAFSVNLIAMLSAISSRRESAALDFHT